MIPEKCILLLIYVRNQIFELSPIDPKALEIQDISNQ
jgi:hypothetical protein